MPADVPPPSTAIPEDLRKQLAEFQRVLWRIKVTEAVLAGIFGLIFSFLFVFAIERQVELPAVVRLGILIAGTSLAAIFAPYWVRRWVYGHRREEQLARLIAKKFPRLGDRLLGIVELQDQDEAKESLSPELRAAAMIHVANQAAKRDMTEALPYSRHKKLALAVVLGTAAIVFGFIIAPKAGENAFKRWLMPLSDTEHYTYTQFDVDRMPNPKVVALGEDFKFEAPLKEDSDRKPAEARARIGQQKWETAKLDDDGTYRFKFPKQEAQGIITVEAGDARHQIRLEPQVRPESDGFRGFVKLPEYLQLEPREISIRTGGLTTVEGSSVVLEGTFSRELSSATAQLLPKKHEESDTPSSAPLDTEASDEAGEADGELPAEPDYQPTLVDMPKSGELKLTVDGKKITSDPIELGRFNADIPFVWTDVNGLDGASSFTVQLKTARDMPPSCYTQGIGPGQVLLPVGQSVEFQILAEDDFGLKEIGLSWTGEFTVPTEGEPAKGSQVFRKGSPSSAQLSENIIFSPEAYGIPPQRIFLSAYTLDYRPGSKRVYSRPVEIRIMTKEEEAEIIKQEFDKVIGDLEEAVRREMDNLDANEKLDREKTAEELQDQDSRDRLAESEAKETENKEKMDEIAKKMEDLFKKAANNEKIDPKTMKKMADALKDMKEMAEQDMPEVEGKLQDAQETNSTPEKTEKDLKEAIEKQKELVDKMKETIKKANEAKENFEASTFVNRLKKASSDQGAIGMSLTESYQNNDSDTFLPLGSTPGADDSDPSHERLLNEVFGRQSTLTGDVRWIMEDLERFFARTQKPIHKELVDEMTDSLIDEKLEELGNKITQNHIFKGSMLAKKWADQLKAWAQKLEGDKDDGGGDGSGGGGGSQEEKDFEFMLKVMRMVQAEQNIRGRTRSLEQLRRSLKLSEE